MKFDKNILGINPFAMLFFVGGLLFCLVWSSFALDNVSLVRLYYAGGLLGGVIGVVTLFMVIQTYFLQAGQMNLQKKQANLDRFESTFFSMMEQHHTIVEGLSFTIYQTVQNNPGKPSILDSSTSEVPVSRIQGRELFKFLYEQYNELPNAGNLFNIGRGIKRVIEKDGVAEYTSNNMPTYFDHYFRHLYHIIKFVNDPEKKYLSWDERYKYTSIVRANLSKYELAWLFYNCLTNHGQHKFKPLIEKYAILKNLRDDILVCSKECSEYRKQHKINNRDFPYNDYEFFQTLREGDITKYNINAFYGPDDRSNAKIEYADKAPDGW